MQLKKICLCGIDKGNKLWYNNTIKRIYCEWEDG